MSEHPISITTLNDFMFCPASIYFHQLDEDTDKLTFQDTCQLEGAAAHEKTDSGTYSTRKSILQAISVYCAQYNLVGKIDTFDSENGILTERKKKIKTVYDGYVFQLYAQYFALKEMHYSVREIRLYSMDDNQIFRINLPENDPEMFRKFSETAEMINSFSLDGFRQQNPGKCERCVYEPLCCFSARNEENHVHCT